MMESDFILVLPVEHIEIADRYSKGEPVPLHCTIAYWFSFEGQRAYEEFLWKIGGISADLFTGNELVSTEYMLLGPNHTPVHLVRRDEGLVRLHSAVHEALKQSGARMVEDRWVGDSWTPHVSNTPESQFQPGSRHVPEYLTLIGRNRKGTKRVLLHWALPRLG